MQEIIENLGRQLGLPEGMVKAGAGAVLQLMQQKAGGGAMQQLFSAIPGAEGLVDAAPAADAGGGDGGGLLGQAAGLLGSLSGGEAGGGVAGLLGSLSSAGFKPDTAAAFVPALLEQLQGAGGQGALDKIVEQVPELKSLTQGGGAGAFLGGLLK